MKYLLSTVVLGILEGLVTPSDCRAVENLQRILFLTVG